MIAHLISGGYQLKTATATTTISIIFLLLRILSRMFVKNVVALNTCSQYNNLVVKFETETTSPLDCDALEICNIDVDGIWI